ncbi:MAG: CRISPR-associated endonuclease Cas1 [Nitrospira sp.]|nr:CRISPR-associated endonuclease Cas1 [Nitrospira sp.]MDH5194071.1 CRISPR-associated endonuclease Cas1 [Nitrospira sp.]
MQLVINSFGAYLRKQGDCFVVKNEDKQFEVSVRKVDSIMITTGAFLSTDAIKAAMDHNIDILFLDEHGDPYGRVWHSKLGSTTLIRRRQLEYADDARGLALAQEWIAAKFDRQMEFLKKLAHARPEKEADVLVYADRLTEGRKKLAALTGTLEEQRGTIMGLEGAAGRTYFEALSFIMPERYRFEGRSRQPAKDEFNCLLNYGYGVLYSMVEKACLVAGLDPYVGFVHTDNYNKKSLVFDLMEMFRYLTDQTVVYLFTGRKVKQEWFESVPGGMTLAKDGKAALIEALNETFETSVRYRNRNIKQRDIIQFECHRIANGLIKEAGDADLGGIRRVGDAETDEDCQGL